MKDLRFTLAKATARILQPLVRLLLRHGLAWADVNDILKRAYVEEAARQLNPENPEAAATSRIAVITGLSRKEVARLRQSNPEKPLAGPGANRAFRVINGWLRDPDFQDSNGKPKPLALNDNDQGFSRLVKRYSGDIPDRAILEELLRIEAVKLENNQAHLLSAGYIPTGDLAEQADIMGQAAADLLNTLVHNLSLEPKAPGTPRLQMSVAYDNLPAEALETFRPESRQASIELLTRFNQWLAEQDRDTTSHPESADTAEHNRYRAGIGIYYFEEPFAEERSGREASQ